MINTCASDVQPGQVYKRGFVIAVVLRRRSGPPDDWVTIKGEEFLLAKLIWWDVLNLSCDIDDPFHAPGTVMAWVSNMFIDGLSERLA